MDTNDNAPKFVDIPEHLEVPREVPSRLSKLVAYDPDQGANGEVLFLLDNDPSGMFDLEPTSGELSFARWAKRCEGKSILGQFWNFFRAFIVKWLKVMKPSKRIIFSILSGKDSSCRRSITRRKISEKNSEKNSEFQKKNFKSESKRGRRRSYFEQKKFFFADQVKKDKTIIFF